MSDDFSADISTIGTVDVGGANANGDLEALGDHDWFRVFLRAGHTYVIKQTGLTLQNPEVRLHNSVGTLVATNDNGSTTGFNGSDAYLRYTPTADGFYYVDAGEHNDDAVGTYQLRVDQQVDRLSNYSVWLSSGTSTSDRLADFNGDGRDDLLQMTGGGIYAALSVPIGSGFNTYAQVSESIGGLGAQIGDFNGDGRADLLQIYNSTREGSAWVDISVYSSNGTAYNQTLWYDRAGVIRAQPVYADQNNAEDLIEISNDRVAVNLSGHVSFQTPTISEIGATSRDQISSGHNGYVNPDVARSDFNGDGLADILQNFAGRAYVSLSQGDGTFGAFQQWSASGGTSADRFGDFNGDGRADLYQYANGTAYVALSTGSSFGAWQVFATGASASDRISDMNGDNRADLFQVFQGRAYVALAGGNNGNNNVTTSIGYDVWNDSGNIQLTDLLGDVNGDGLTDVVHVDNTNAIVYQSLPIAGGDQHLLIT